MLDSRLVGGEARIGTEELALPHGTKALKLTIVTDGQNEIIITGRKGLIGHDVRMRIAQSPRRSAGRQIVHRLVCHGRNLDVQ